MSQTQFEDIYLNQSRVPGQVRMSDHGLGWKATTDRVGGSAKISEPVLIPTGEVVSTQWSRGSRGYEIKVQTKNRGVFQLDGFDTAQFNQLRNALKNHLGIALDSKEHSVRGWNWGKMDFERSELVFNVSSRPAFEIPYSAVSNSNLVGKNEVAVEFDLQTASERVSAGDELVEMRFYVPGTVPKGDEEEKEDQKKEEEEDEDAMEIDGEEQSAASAFYEALKERADIGQVAGEAIVSFSDILFLTPRGRYDVDMYDQSLRLRGKTYDYKIQYQNIKRLFSLPKPDGLHHMLIMQLDPPLRQGQTRYPFLVMQFFREDIMEVELNVEDEEYKEKYAGKLEKSYDRAAYKVVGDVMKGLADKRMVEVGSFRSANPKDESGVSCSLKANEGYLYPLDKCFMFVPKPTLYIPLVDIQSVTFTRVSSSARTFDLLIKLKNKGGEHQFSNIDRDEQTGLQNFIQQKGIKFLDDKAERDKSMREALAVEEESDLEPVDRGSADEDEESVDEDFEIGDESDVAEEFDSNAESSSGSEDEGEYSGSGSEAGSPARKKAKH
ncbi:FACT complex subunit Pob3p [Trichomonascus vanleenenianus]|uniref:FACT complex subunit POB3 n=1 Tax=Trichomonascus vanleenenianus TaxID=2268995 RepID=UPI003EC98B35